jgi:hypothetical protein
VENIRVRCQPLVRTKSPLCMYERGYIFIRAACQSKSLRHTSHGDIPSYRIGIISELADEYKCGGSASVTSACNDTGTDMDFVIDLTNSRLGIYESVQTFTCLYMQTVDHAKAVHFTYFVVLLTLQLQYNF